MQDALPAIILAGGLARRMGGGDKAFLMLGDSPLIGHVIERLAPQAAPLALNANGDPARFSDLGLPVIADSVAGFPGPLAGVLAGLDWAASLGAQRVVTVAADTPFFPTDLVARLRRGVAAARAPLALAATRAADGGIRRHPTFGLWPVALREPLRKAIATGTRRVSRWAEDAGSVDVLFDTHAAPDPFFNINTLEDLARAARMAGAG